jgi:TonB family protein
MYDDLARTQRSSLLELLTLNMVIPSVLLTLAIAPPHVNARQVVPRFYGESWPVMLGTVGSESRARLHERAPDAPASLRWMPLPLYPTAMLEARQEGHVVIKARVDAEGRVRWESSVVLQAAYAEFVEPVREAMKKAEFRPASATGVPMESWVIISVYFDIYVE